MTSIGRRCTGGNVLSRAILITQTLSETKQTKQQTSVMTPERGKTRAPSGECGRLWTNLTHASAPSSILTFFQVTIAQGLHLFPFRTEKLNPAAPMVLRKWESR